MAQSPEPFLNLPLLPPTVAPGSASFILTVNGGNFTSNSILNWNGKALATTYASATRITATVPAADVAAAGTAVITVSNPAPSPASLPALFPVFSPSATLTFKKASTLVGVAPVSIVVADFNGDGKADLAFANTQPSNANPVLISVNLGNGDGTFTQSATITTVDQFFPGGYVLSGDFNNDGYADLAFGAGPDGGSEFDVALGNGNGTFQPPVVSSAGESGYQFTIGDFNRDGKLDLANMDFSDIGSRVVYLGNGDGSFNQNFSILQCCGNNLSVGDFNGDGVLDLTAGTTAMLGDGAGNFTDPPIGSSGSVYVTLVADFNGDGIQDVGIPGSPTTVYLGKGDGTFTQKIQPQTLNSIFLLTADFDGDGILDLISVDGVSSAVSIAFGNGDGTFQSPINYATSSLPTSLALGDFNNDGYLDVAYTSGADVEILLGGAATSKIATETMLTSSRNPSVRGEPVTFTARVSPRKFAGSPLAGKVTFFDGTTELASRALGPMGSVSISVSSLSAGVHRIGAVYSGNSTFARSRSALIWQQVRKYADEF